MKKEIIRLYSQLLQQKIDTYQEQIRSLSEDAQNDAKSSSGDKHETALSMMHIEQEKLTAKLREVMEQFKQLQQIDADQIHDQVRRGSVVVTEQWVFLIALALPELTYQDKKVIGVSLEAPLAQKLMYKKAKDTLQMGTQNYTILYLE